MAGRQRGSHAQQIVVAVTADIDLAIDVVEACLGGDPQLLACDYMAGYGIDRHAVAIVVAH